MSNPSDDISPVPGLEVVGRGVYLRPRQPYELRALLFQRDGAGGSIYSPQETGKRYIVPVGYEVSDSPPMPENQALNHTFIEESWDRFGKQINESAGLAVSSAAFNIDANASQLSSLRSDHEAYYALRNSFVPFWCVYLPDTTSLPADTFDFERFPIPKSFSHSDRAIYTEFFERYGSHYVKRAWVGGKASLAFIVEKSQDVSKAEIQAGLKASFGLGGNATANKDLKTSRDKLLNTSVCQVFGAGGDETLLAKLSNLDEAVYHQWLGTIKTNPQVIHLELAGIWTLFDDTDQAAALQAAYQEEVRFQPISAICNIGRGIYFLRDGHYFAYDLDKRRVEPEKPMPITELCATLKDPPFLDFKWPDAAFTGSQLYSHTREPLSGKVYLFKGGSAIRIDQKTHTIDPGYPKPLQEEWPGLAFKSVDAILNAGPDAVYFFKGGNYVRYEMSECRYGILPGYPKPIKEHWLGLIFDRIDAAIYWRFDKVYFFSGDQYIRYDMSNYRADAGYPKSLPSNYVQDWQFFD